MDDNELNKTNELKNQSEQNVDWNDDSGEIHTIKHKYHLSAKDGWQRNRALYGSHVVTSDRRRIKGTQVGYTYVTDDFRKVLPGYIIGTILMIVISIVFCIFIPFVGILVSIFSIVWIIGMWKQAPIKKWQNQAKKIKQEKENKN